MTTVLVTGSREWPPTATAMGVIFRYLDLYMSGSWDYPELLQGECPEGGVDAYAAAYCYGAGYGVHSFPAEPSEGQTRLYPRDFARRNQLMVDQSPDVVLAFFLEGAGNKGTQMTVDMAKKKGLFVHEIHYDAKTDNVRSIRTEAKK